MPELSLGVARADITPRHPVPLAGFAARANLGPAETVARPLRLRVLTFAPHPDASPQAVFVTADLLWWGPELTDGLREKIARRYGVPAGAVLLHASHTHSAPATSAWYSTYLGVPDPTYVNHLTKLTLEAVDESLGNMEPVTAARAASEVPIGADRRSVQGGFPRSDIDPTATVVRFIKGNGATKAVLVHFACHPVISHTNTMTPDFVGAARETLEQQLPADAVAVYAQGCCGDINPDRYDGRRFLPGDDSDVAAFGGRLARAAAAVLNGPMAPLDRPCLATGQHRAALPLAPLPTREALLRSGDLPGIKGEWARRMLAEPHRLRPDVTLELTALRLFENLTLLGMSAEPTSAYGRYIHQRYAGRVLPLGYTGAVFGYLVTAHQLTEGGYEPAEAPRYFAMPAPLSPSAETVARTAIDTTLAPLAE